MYDAGEPGVAISLAAAPSLPGAGEGLFPFLLLIQMSARQLTKIGLSVFLGCLQQCDVSRSEAEVIIWKRGLAVPMPMHVVS